MTTILRAGYIVMIAVAAILAVAVLGYAGFSYYKKREAEKNRAVTMHKEELDMTTSHVNETSVVVSV